MTPRRPLIVHRVAEKVSADYEIIRDPRDDCYYIYTNRPGEAASWKRLFGALALTLPFTAGADPLEVVLATAKAHADRGELDLAFRFDGDAYNGDGAWPEGRVVRI